MRFVYPRLHERRSASRRTNQKCRRTKASTETPTETERSWHILAAAPMLHLGYGTLPSLSRGVGIALGVTSGAWSILATAALFAQQTSHRSNVRDYEMAYRNRSIDGWICRAWEWMPLRIAPCGLLAVILVTCSASGGGIAELLFVDALWGEEQVRRTPLGVLKISVGPERFF